MSHFKLHFTLHTRQSSHSTLHTSHCTLHTALFTLHPSQSTLHFTLHSSHSKLPTSQSTLHFTVHTSHFSLLPSHSKLHTSHCTLHAPHFTLHSSHPTLHLIWALLTLSHLSSSHLISSHMSSKLSWVTSQYYYNRTCMRRAPATPVRACFVRSCCSVAVQEHDLRATPIQCKHFPHTSHCILHTPHSTLHTCTSSQLISSELFSSHSMSSHMSAKFFLPIFMSSTSQYWCLLQKLAKLLPSTTLYYKKLGQSTSQYYFVLQSLHKAHSSTTLLLPSTTLYYKACTKSFPVLLCIATLAQTTSQYYFVLQGLHNVLPSTTLYYKACTQHFPVLLCTTKSLRKALPIASKSLNDIGSSAAVPKGLCSRKHCRAMSATPRYWAHFSLAPGRRHTCGPRPGRNTCSRSSRTLQSVAPPAKTAKLACTKAWPEAAALKVHRQGNWTDPGLRNAMHRSMSKTLL